MISNRLNELLDSKKKIFSVFYTAGFPRLNDTLPTCRALAEAGVNLVEIGVPFSDPVADGPIIQASSEVALKNGMSVKVLFEQLLELRPNIKIPVLLMGYINPILQFGIEKFCQHAAKVGVDGVILPDLPVEEFTEKYRPIFEQNNLHNIFLITPNTSEERIRKIDSLSTGFIYGVSSFGVTGRKISLNEERESYFRRLESLNLKSPIVVGFGISNAEAMSLATKYHRGGIVGSAFVSYVRDASDPIAATREFVKAFGAIG